MKRAMTDGAKAERAKQILNAAESLYKTSTFQDVKMVDIAQTAGVSKGTLFNYYISKESIFMEMLFEEYNKRFKKMETLLLEYDAMTKEDFKDFVIKEIDPYLDEESIYIRLNAIKNTILEKNIDYDVAMKDKVHMYENGQKLGHQISRLAPFMTPEKVMEFFLAQNAIIVGTINLSESPKAIKEGIIQKNLSGFNIDFKSTALKIMTSYMDGFL